MFYAVALTVGAHEPELVTADESHDEVSETVCVVVDEFVYLYLRAGIVASGRVAGWAR